MSWQPEVDEIAYRHALAAKMGGDDKVARHKAAGKLTVRERISACTDPDSFTEVDAMGVQRDGVIVAATRKGQHEFMVGARMDPIFGPVVVVGDGGKYVEALKDCAVLLPPFSEADVQAALRTLRIAPLLDGVRGEPPLDVAALSRIAASLPGVRRVSAKDVVELLGQGAVVVDTRTEKEYRAKRIRGAVWAAYGEKSLKDVAFNPEQDDFKTLETLDRSKALIFSCNGAECWKSYKAAKVAADKGFRNVYWMRGGLPEWDAEGLPTEGG